VGKKKRERLARIEGRGKGLGVEKEVGSTNSFGKRKNKEKITEEENYF